MDSLSGQDCVFVLDQWRSYAFQLGRHYLSDDGRCDLCYKAIGRGDGLARDVAGVTRGLKAETDMRTAIDKYAEKDLAGKPGWEDFDLLTRH